MTTSFPNNRSVLRRLVDHARVRPSACAVRDRISIEGEPRQLSYGQLNRQSTGMARSLRQQLAPGSVVLLCAPNACEFVTAFIGVWKAGMTVFPLSPSLNQPEISNAIVRSAASAVIGTKCILDALPETSLPTWRLSEVVNMSCEGDADEPTPANGALFLQSSGPTDYPKIVRRLGPSLDAVARHVCTSLELTDQDRVLAVIPMCHSYGVEHALLGPLFAGAEIHAVDHFDPSVIDHLLREEGITLFPATPFILEALAKDSNKPLRHSLRCVYSAGGPLPAMVYERFSRRSGMPIGQLYGSTEVGSVVYNSPSAIEFDSTSVGQAMEGVVIRIVDPENPDPNRPLKSGVEGHVAIRSESMLDGYVDDDAPVLVDGYFLTGDLGRLDKNGRLFLTGRIKLQFDIGGMKVNPLEVEQVIMDFPGIAECIVVPVMVTSTLNRLRALIVPQTLGEDLDVEAIRHHVRGRLAGYKVPRIIEIRTSLTRSPTGKLARVTMASENP